MESKSGDRRRSSAALRAALMSGLATVFMASLAGPASAQFGGLFGSPTASNPRATQAWINRHRSYARRWQQQTAEPAKPKAQVAPEKPQKPLTIVISIKNQKASLYGNGKLIETSIISTGTPGYDTPQGVFSVIEKDRHHRSNIYSGAPMPYMQRITWSGVALHQGFVTGRPASHGCIRLPQAFAARLWELTDLGVRVIVAPDDVHPVSISHERLFAMKPKPAPQPVAALQPDPVPTAKIRLATNAERSDTQPVAEAAPIVETHATLAAPAAPEATAEADPLAEGRALTDLIRAEVQPQQAPSEPTMEPAQQAATEPVKEPTKEQAKEVAKEATVEPEPVAAFGKPGNLDKLKLGATGKEYPSRPGTVTVFISRSAGKLYVRKGFWPVFETPVKIAQPDVPFGTHVFTALEPKSATELHWNVVSMPNEVKRGSAMPLTRGERRLGAVAGVRETVRPANPADVLSRISIPDEAVDRISEMMSPGASLIVSDMGVSNETNRGTDFIVQIR
jgi:lipoprotein-anchoring transpeptidase ErfK/SrfK